MVCTGRVKGARMSWTVPGLRQLTPSASLVLVAAAGAWAGVALLARHMGAMPGTMGLGLGAFVAVWALMMAAMMLPSVTPFASLYSRMLREGRGRRLTIFAACGVYQLTPLKDRCLARCRSPLGFVFKLGTFRGRTRDLRVGLYHGAFCLACCWALMALLVAFGLMNVIAMVVLAAAVLTEKTWVWGPRFSRVLGIAALGLAVAVVFVPGLAPGLHQAANPGQMGGM